MSPKVEQGLYEMPKKLIRGLAAKAILVVNSIWSLLPASRILQNILRCFCQYNANDGQSFVHIMALRMVLCCNTLEVLNDKDLHIGPAIHHYNGLPTFREKHTLSDLTWAPEGRGAETRAAGRSNWCSYSHDPCCEHGDNA